VAASVVATAVAARVIGAVTVAAAAGSAAAKMAMAVAAVKASAVRLAAATPVVAVGVVATRVVAKLTREGAVVLAGTVLKGLLMRSRLLCWNHYRDRQIRGLQPRPCPRSSREMAEAGEVSGLRIAQKLVRVVARKSRPAVLHQLRPCSPRQRQSNHAPGAQAPPSSKMARRMEDQRALADPCRWGSER